MITNFKTRKISTSRIKTEVKQSKRKLKSKIQLKLLKKHEKSNTKDTFFTKNIQQTQEPKNLHISSTYFEQIKELKRQQSLPIFIFNNKNNEKVKRKFDIRDSSQYLKIGQANFFQKDVKGSISSISSISSRMILKRKLEIGGRPHKISGFHECYFAHFNANQSHQSQEKQNKQMVIISQNQHYFHQILKIYLKNIENKCKMMNSQFYKINKYPNNYLTYSLEGGNGMYLLESAMRKRWWWIDAKTICDKNPLFSWTQIKTQQYFIRGIQRQQYENKQINLNNFYLNNHLRQQKYLTNSLALLQISRFNNKLNIPKKYYITQINCCEWIRLKRQNYMNMNRQHNILLNYDIQDNNKYWIVKNSNNNECYLQIISSYENLQLYIKQNVSENKKFIIEQYISNPLLYNMKKMSIKAYILILKINNKLNIYWYKQGIINISSQYYDLYNKNLYIHFTSDSIQLNHPQYSEEINKMTFQTFLKIFRQNQQQKILLENVFNQMKNISKYIIENIYTKLLNQQNQSFGLYQFNFIIDQKYVPWLISIHSNPRLQSTASSIQKLYQIIIDDCLKLTLDIIYPPPQVWPKNRMYLLNKKINQNGFEPIQVEQNRQQIKQFKYENLIIDDRRYFQGNTQQPEITLMHFFPQKMRSCSRKSINFATY